MINEIQHNESYTNLDQAIQDIYKLREKARGMPEPYFDIDHILGSMINTRNKGFKLTK